MLISLGLWARRNASGPPDTVAVILNFRRNGERDVYSLYFREASTLFEGVAPVEQVTPEEVLDWAMRQGYATLTIGNPSFQIPGSRGKRLSGGSFTSTDGSKKYAGIAAQTLAGAGYVVIRWSSLRSALVQKAEVRLHGGNGPEQETMMLSVPYGTDMNQPKEMTAECDLGEWDPRDVPVCFNPDLPEGRTEAPWTECAKCPVYLTCCMDGVVRDVKVVTHDGRVDKDKLKDLLQNFYRGDAPKGEGP